MPHRIYLELFIEKNALLVVSFLDKFPATRAPSIFFLDVEHLCVQNMYYWISLLTVKRYEAKVTSELFISPLAVYIFLFRFFFLFQLSTMDAFPYLTVPSIVSMLLSLYAYILLYRLCRTYLVPLSISVKFFSLQMVIALTRLQSIVMDILASNGIPACRGALSTVALSQSEFCWWMEG